VLLAVFSAACAFFAPNAGANDWFVNKGGFFIPEFARNYYTEIGRSGRVFGYPASDGKYVIAFNGTGGGRGVYKYLTYIEDLRLIFFGPWAQGRVRGAAKHVEAIRAMNPGVSFRFVGHSLGSANATQLWSLVGRAGQDELVAVANPFVASNDYLGKSNSKGVTLINDPGDPVAKGFFSRLTRWRRTTPSIEADIIRNGGQVFHLDNKPAAGNGPLGINKHFVENYVKSGAGALPGVRGIPLPDDAIKTPPPGRVKGPLGEFPASTPQFRARLTSGLGVASFGLHAWNDGLVPTTINTAEGVGILGGLKVAEVGLGRYAAWQAAPGFTRTLASGGRGFIRFGFSAAERLALPLLAFDVGYQGGTIINRNMGRDNRTFLTSMMSYYWRTAWYPTFGDPNNAYNPKTATDSVDDLQY
jgi:hypothetical protein